MLQWIERCKITFHFLKVINMKNIIESVFTAEVEKTSLGIYHHSSPASCRLYDSIWSEEQPSNSNIEKPRSFEEIKNNVIRTLSLIYSNGINEELASSLFQNKTVLDVCAGHGGSSFAAADMGASHVYMCDGSRKALEIVSKKVSSNVSYERYIGKISQIQADVDRISEVFHEKSFDVVIQRYAIHHVRNPLKTAYDLASLVKPGGMLSFNYFTKGCTPKINRILRNHFLKKDISYIRDLFITLQRLGPKDEKTTKVLNDVVSGNLMIDERYLSTVELFKALSNEYGFNELNKRLHYEDANTPYVHNIDRNIMNNFVTEQLGLEIIDFRNAIDEQSLTLLIPERGLKTPTRIPEIFEYSDEDVSLGDTLIKLLNGNNE